jgi:hypothetical protein
MDRGFGVIARRRKHADPRFGDWLAGGGILNENTDVHRAGS